jgi:hypothetical protein
VGTTGELLTAEFAENYRRGRGEKRRLAERSERSEPDLDRKKCRNETCKISGINELRGIDMT